ncbi:MAG: carboxypeptidase-like regulatory domain-containing protein, partial [Oscillibacter sp.]
MKKRMLSMALTLCLVLSLLPTVALAANATTVILVTQTLNGTNSYLVNGAAADSGTLGTGGCTAYFDATTGTLALKDATLSGSDYGIYCPSGDLTILLEGSNTASASSSHAIQCDGTLTIKNAEGKTGSLTAASTLPSGNGNGIWAGNLVIESGEVTASAATAINGIYSHDTITISGGTVTASGGSHGIQADTSLSVSGSAVVRASTTSGDGAIVGSMEGAPTIDTTTHNVFAGADDANAVLNGPPKTSKFAKLVPGVTISGKITDGTTAIQGATVQIRKSDADFGAPATTAANGTYTTQTVPQGAYTLKISKPGYADKIVSSFDVADASVTDKDETLTSNATVMVGSTPVTNGINITYWLNDSTTPGGITATGATSANYHVKYDPTAPTPTLTLKGATISGSNGGASRGGA